MTNAASTVGLALIVRDEEESLPRLLRSVEGAFDQVVLVDTGSKDQTVRVFWDWVNAHVEQHGPFAHACRVESFTWVDDFAAARVAADGLLETDWLCWADADDELRGAGFVRQIAAQAPDEVAAFIASYQYAHDQHGNCVCTLKRERIIRRGRGTWTGRVHEAQLIDGATMLIDPGTVQWVHHKPHEAPESSPRNLRILRAWVKDEPENPRVLGYLGTEEAAMGRHKRAVGYFRRYLKLKTGWDQERAQIHRKLSMCLMALGRPQDALETALAALAVLPDWPDSHLTLAETSYQLGEHEKAIKWAREVLRLGHPDSLLILNPLDYAWRPLLVMAGALGALGRADEAAAMADEALKMVPDHAELQQHAYGWKATAKREHTANSWIGAAQMLIAHDEQLKALTLLEDTVPHFATDHPNVVALRSQVRERLLWLRDPKAYAEHYETGGSKPEDFIDDDKIVELCEYLPRTRFLRDGLREQLQEAA